MAEMTRGQEPDVDSDLSDIRPLDDEDRFLLSEIKDPIDLVGLSHEELDQICDEIRAMILATVSRNGGHLASSLGAVEIVVALHRVLSSPGDAIVYDVGHQSLAHKLLTGRFDQFATLRQHGGISGFPRRQESPYDVHDSGHASDSLSTAIGLLEAKELTGEPGEVAVVIGDASVSGGMAFEALNHIGQLGKNLIIVLNDNEMSISRNVGAISLYLGKIRLSSKYKNTRDSVEGHLASLGWLGQDVVRLGEAAKESVKKLLVGGTLFEDMNITYIGPIDGHDLSALEEALKSAKRHNGPVLVHAVTAKGKGYEPAERDASFYHGTPGFDLETGKPCRVPGSSGFTKTFSALMVAEGRRNPSLVAITAAMTDGTGLAAFEGEFPGRFYDVGISEEHAVAMAAGLAIGGCKPVVAIYSTFMQRAFDQIITNVALPNLNVTLCLDRAGVVGADGSTHHGLFDLAYLRLVPNMTVLAPSSPRELAGAFAFAMRYDDGPIAIRYPRMANELYEPTGDEEPWEFARSRVVREGGDVTILAVGNMVENALAAADLLAEKGIECMVRDMRWVKPLDAQAVCEARRSTLIVTVEDGTVVGGFADAVLEELSALRGRDDAQDFGNPPLVRLGAQDVFVGHGATGELYRDLGLAPDQIAARIISELA